MIQRKKKIVKTLKSKKSKAKDLDLFFILDCSGSMGAYVKQVREGLEKFFSEQEDDMKETGAKTFLTFTKFGTSVEIITEGEDLSDLSIVPNSYEPNMGGTALFDAIGETLDTEHAVDAVKNSNNKLIVIQTDGHENSSRRYKSKEIKSRIKELEDSDDWTVLFLGQDVGIECLEQIGVELRSSVNYTGDQTTDYFKNASILSKAARLSKVQDTAVMMQSLAEQENDGN